MHILLRETGEHFWWLNWVKAQNKAPIQILETQQWVIEKRLDWQHDRLTKWPCSEKKLPISIEMFHKWLNCNWNEMRWRNWKMTIWNRWLIIKIAKDFAGKKIGQENPFLNSEKQKFVWMIYCEANDMMKHYGFFTI